LRGFRKQAYERMGLRTTGMEFATEMVVKATLLKMRVAEVPTTLSPDGRSRPPHLRTWRDGWRTLRFFLLYSPRWLFLYPGLGLMLLGTLLGAWLLPAPRTVAGVTFDVHTLLYAAVFVLLGFQAIAFAVFTKLFAISEGLHPPDPTLDKAFRYITLEVGLLAGALFILAGLGVSVYAVGFWQSRHFGRTRLCPNHAAGDPGVVVPYSRRADGIREFLFKRARPAAEIASDPLWNLPNQFAEKHGVWLAPGNNHIRSKRSCTDCAIPSLWPIR
jgi:hypothetical protein